MFLSDVDLSTARNYPILSSVLESYSRHIKVGDSEGFCGANFIVLISRAFTAGEDAVMLWAQMQDDATLVDIINLSDGRDYIILKRLYIKQTYRDALNEQAAFANDFLSRSSTQHDTSDTPKVSTRT